MTEPVYTVVYRSYARPPYMDRRTLNAIAREAHGHNERQGITGLLIFLDGMFLQILEGTTVALLELTARIAADHRNDRLKVLWHANDAPRRFPDWAMGCFDFSEVSPGRTPLPVELATVIRGDAPWTRPMTDRLARFYEANRTGGIEPVFTRMRRIEGS
ncbi:MAG: BLUF domain-containing protein [Pseudomonadota bacterium]